MVIVHSYVSLPEGNPIKILSPKPITMLIPSKMIKVMIHGESWRRPSITNPIKVPLKINPHYKYIILM